MRPIGIYAEATDAADDESRYCPECQRCVDAERLKISLLESELDRLRAEHAKRELDSRLGDALRASGISVDDALAVQTLYAIAGQSGSHRIVSALRAVEAWLRSMDPTP